MVMKLLSVALALALATAANHAKTDSPKRSDAKPMPDFSGMALVDLKNGINTIDLDGDGVNDMVVSGYRENGNAHSYVTYTFYAQETLSGGDSTRGALWGVVPFFAPEYNPNVDYVRDVEGADCILQDIAVLRPKSARLQPVMVVLAKREFGSSFADAMPVMFEIFKVVRNDDSNVGWPPVYFEQAQVIRAKHNYCDVNDAMQKELGVRFPGGQANKTGE